MNQVHANVHSLEAPAYIHIHVLGGSRENMDINCHYSYIESSISTS